MALFVGIATATPAGISHGDTVNLSDSGFGTKPTAAPVLYDDFSGGTAGNNINQSAAVVGTWETGVGSEEPEYTATNARVGGLCSLHPFQDSPEVSNASLCQNFDESDCYVDFHIRADFITVESRNWKPWRLFDTAGSRDMANIVFFCFGAGGYVTVENMNNWMTEDLFENDYADGVWQHHQIVYRAGTNGKGKSYVNCVPFYDNSDDLTQPSINVGQVRIGHFWGVDSSVDCPANPGANVYVDNVYIDSSFARVEIGNNPTYNSCTQREIQRCTAWSDTAITFTANVGAFPNDTSGTIFVINNNDQVVYTEAATINPT